MAVATGTAIMAGTSLAGGAFKAISGAKQQKRARKAAEEFERNRQKLTNVNRNRRISTMGADLAREESQRNMGMSVDALRSGGTRGLANIGGVVQANNQMNRQIGAGLDQQQVQLDREIAADDQRIQQMQENREMQTQANLQQQQNFGQQQVMGGLGDIAGGLSTAAAYGAFDGGAGKAFQGSGQGLPLSSNPLPGYGDPIYQPFDPRAKYTLGLSNNN